MVANGGHFLCKRASVRTFFLFPAQEVAEAGEEEGFDGLDVTVYLVFGHILERDENAGVIDVAELVIDSCAEILHVRRQVHI